MGFATTWLRQVSPPASQNHFNHWMNLGQPVFIEAKDDGGGGDNWTTGAISRAKLLLVRYIFRGLIIFPTPSQQRQGTEGIIIHRPSSSSIIAVRFQCFGDVGWLTGMAQYILFQMFFIGTPLEWLQKTEPVEQKMIAVIQVVVTATVWACHTQTLAVPTLLFYLLI